MGRPSKRLERRRELTKAFERALAIHGLGNATIAAVADEAGCAPGLIHHHFSNREDMMAELVRSLMGRFRAQLPKPDEPGEFLLAYADAALALGPQSGRTAAKAWVGIFAEAIRSKPVRDVLKRSLRTELVRLENRYEQLGYDPQSAERNAAGLLSSILGCLVFGALMPGKATGFAAPYVKTSLSQAIGGSTAVEGSTDLATDDS